MALPKITGAQRDFSGGELDEAMKRADETPAMKIGARQLSNWRVLSGGQLTNRPGKRALFSETGRVEEILMAPGQIFYVVFGNGYLRVYNAAGTRVFGTHVLGDGSSAIPWTTATMGAVSFAVASGAGLSIYIAYADNAPLNRPQILTWDGVSQTSTWTLTQWFPTVTLGNQTRTIFSRISTQNVTIVPGGQTNLISLTASGPVFYLGQVGTLIEWCGAQIRIIAVDTPTYALGAAQQFIPGGQSFIFTGNVLANFELGDEVIGSITGAKGIVTGLSANNLNVQVIPTSSGSIVYFDATVGETIAGPNGSLPPAGISPALPSAVAIWDDEVMNDYYGFPSNVFFDQNRLGFSNFPPLQSGISWSAIGLPNDMYVSATASVTADSAIFEFAPGKSQVLYVLAGMESSEFVFCDNAIYYIPISLQFPLAPGSVAFNKLSDQGCYPVRPQPIQQSILFMKRGGAQVGAVQAPGAFYRPYVVDNVSEFHSHLFTVSPPVCIAAPSALGQFEESYAYILLANGNVVMAKYNIRQGLLDVGMEGKPKMGWLPWTSVANCVWISAQSADVIFTSLYNSIGGGFSNGFSSGFGGSPTFGLVEILDATQYLDAAILVNAAPAALAPPTGLGPLWFAAGATVTLMDTGARMMGTYQVSTTGYIVPQFNGGENLASAVLTAGQPWTATLEPFVPDAQPGPDEKQRMAKRRLVRFGVYVSSSTGFLMARLFSGPLTRTSPALGTIMNQRRVTTWNQDDDPTQPPPLREEVQRWRPLGRSFDPRIAIIKDTPGPLLIHEIGLEASV